MIFRWDFLRKFLWNIATNKDVVVFDKHTGPKVGCDIKGFCGILQSVGGEISRIPPVGQFGNGKSPELVTSIANGVSQMMFMVCLFVFGRSIVKFADDNILHNTESKVIFQNIKFYWVFFNKNKINLERRKLNF